MKLSAKILVLSSLFSTAYSSELISELEKYNPQSSFLSNITLYGIGDKFEKNFYNGVGFNYNSDYAKVIIEKNNNYKKVSMIKRLDINENLYSKFALAHLSKKVPLNENIENLNQSTLATALGYGDDISYNIEFGYFENKLMNINNSSSKIYYTELSLKYDIDKIGSVDYTFSHQSKKGFETVITDYVATTSYYPQDDIKLGLKYNSISHNDDFYKVSAKLNYRFDDITNFLGGKLYPTISVENNTSENISFVATYKKDIAKRSLKIKNKFNAEATTNDILARKIDIKRLQEELM
uniref:hypothetical protein n=1 Tax=Aliarcobacter sp. TaxID=2321116 RepID=UPI00404850BC